MENFEKIVPIIVSMLALVVSAINAYNGKREVLANTIAENRMDWIAQVRSLIGEFIEKYIKRDDELELAIVKSKIDLYIVYNSEWYAEFEKKMEYCVKNPYTETDYKELVILSQKVINNVWTRIKLESGISRSEERRIAKTIKQKLLKDRM